MDNICLKHTRVKNFSLLQRGASGPKKSDYCEPVPTEEAVKAREILDIVTELVFSDDITVGKLRLATHALLSGFPVDSYSNKEIAGLVGKSERTARSIRAWAGGISAFDKPCKKKVAACSEFISKLNTKVTSKEQIHQENKFLSTEMELVLTHLCRIGFNSFEGEITVPRRSARTISWVDRWGVDNVLHALWIANGPRGATRNKAGFVRTLVESGLQAPEGWSHPEMGNSDNLPMESVSEPSFPIAPSSPIAPFSPSEPVHALVTEALREKTRPNAYRKWLQDLRFADADDSLVCWCPTPTHLAAAQGPYRRILDEVLWDLGLTIAEFQVGVEDDSNGLSAVAESPTQSISFMHEPGIDCTHETIVNALKREVAPTAFTEWFEILRFTKQNDRTICWSPSRSHLATILAGRKGTDLQRVLSSLGINEFGFGVGDVDSEAQRS